MSIIFAILIFSFLIFIHEFGHFITAKLSGVQVNEFAMFMGPAIWKKQRGETLYSIRCIPIGGYCAMEGEDQDTDNPRSFQKAAWWKRLIILVAGSAMNLVAGFLIVVLVNSFALTPIPEIESLRTGSALMEEGGLQADDVILQIDGYAVEHTSDFDKILGKNDEAKKLDVLVLRDGKQVLLQDVTFELREFQQDAEGEAGLYYGLTWKTRRLTFGEVISHSWLDCVSFVEMVWMSLGMLFSGEAGVGDLTGPVGIVGMMSDMANASASVSSAVLNMLYFGGFIAINLGVMNMLPIPALDGGRVFALLITTAIVKITKKPVNPKIEGYIHAGGMILLLGFMAFVMFKDIFTIFKG